ncbi:hypothetical protein ACWG5P_26075 [Streptomyces prasinus]
MSVLDAGHYRTTLEAHGVERRRMFTHPAPDGVVWADGTKEPVDTILWAVDVLGRRGGIGGGQFVEADRLLTQRYGRFGSCAEEVVEHGDGGAQLVEHEVPVSAGQRDGRYTDRLQDDLGSFRDPHGVDVVGQEAGRTLGRSRHRHVACQGERRLAET